MRFPDDDTPLYHLLSNYNNVALQHGAWLAGLIVAAFAYMGLSLRGSNPSWGWGSLSVLLSLGFFIGYSYGRMHYFSILTGYIISGEVKDPYQTTLRSANEKAQKLLERDVGKSIGYWFAYQFRESFKPVSVIVSLIIGLGIAFFLYSLGWVAWNYK